MGKFKKVLALSLALLICLQLAACGGKEASTTSADVKEFVYVAEYKEIETGNWIGSMCSSGDKFYYSTSIYNEEEQTSTTKFYEYDIAAGVTKELPISSAVQESVQTNIQQMAVNSEGNLVMHKNTYIVENDDWENAVETNTVVTVNPTDGSVISDTDITLLLKEEDSSYIQYMVVDKDNNIYLCNGQSKIWVLNKDGQQIFTVDLNDNWVQGMGVTKEGQAVYMSWDTGAQGAALSVIDAAAKGVSKTCTKNVPNSYGDGSITAGVSGGLLISGENGVIEYNTETETATELFNFLDSDINRENVRFIKALEDGRIFTVVIDYSSDENKTEAAILTKKKTSEVYQKEILTLGALYTDSATMSTVIKFNKTNEKYRITLKTYDTSGDWEAARTQFNNDVMAGNGADIFDLSSLNLTLLATKGLVEDLGPYLDNDPDINREDYFQSVLNAYTIDGKLCTIPNTFYIQTLLGKASQVGDTPGWTIDDLINLVESSPEGTEVLGYANKLSILQTCMMFSANNYVNWETGECKFNTDDFIKLLEFANTFPSEFQYDEETPSEAQKIRDGKQLLMSAGFSSIEDYQRYELIFEEPMTAIGYPNPAGNNGSVISGSTSFAINAKSKYKEGAWEFIKSMIGPSYYENNKNSIWSFPTLISSYEELNKKYTEPETYEDGNEGMALAASSYYMDGMEIELGVTTKEQEAAVTDLINNCSFTYNYDEQLMNIINEEVAPFFEGQKSAGEAADIIQSRVKIYVNESR